MKKLSIFLIASSIALGLQPCASIFCGTKAKVTFDYNVKEGVSLTIDGIKRHVVDFPNSSQTLYIR